MGVACEIWLPGQRYRMDEVLIVYFLLRNVGESAIAVPQWIGTLGNTDFHLRTPDGHVVGLYHGEVLDAWRGLRPQVVLQRPGDLWGCVRAIGLEQLRREWRGEDRGRAFGFAKWGDPPSAGNPPESFRPCGDLTPGRYRLVATFISHDCGDVHGAPVWRGRLRSNEVTFEIVPG